MKKLLLLLLVFPFVFSSCSDDDDDSSKIVGTWMEKPSKVVEVITNNEKATQAIKDDVASWSYDGIFVFTPDGKYTYTDGDADSDVQFGTYTLSGKSLKLTTSEGGSHTRDVYFSGNTFYADVDQTERFKDEIKYLVPNEVDVEVTKVIIRYTNERVK